MKKRFYLLGVAGLIFMSGSIFIMARLGTMRRIEIRNELKRNPSFARLDALYNEVARAGDEGTVLKEIDDLRTLARLNELKSKIEKEAGDLDQQIKKVEDEIRAQSPDSVD